MSLETEFTREYFERMASLEDTHPWTRGMRKITFELLKRHARQVKRVLDVGCGTGRFLREWREIGAKEVFGADLYTAALEFARERCKGQWAAASAAALPFVDASFDALHCADVIQHLTFKDAEIAFNEFARVLRPGGIVALRVGARRTTGTKPEVDYSHSYRVRELRAELKKRNFDVLFLARVNALPSLYAELQEKPMHDAPVKHIEDRAQHDPRSQMLETYLQWERHWLLATGISLPWGHTIIAIARKNATHLS